MSRALYAGVTGLQANSYKLDIIGNNIANLNTTGYKSSRAVFGDLLSQTINGGSAAVSGGTSGLNPSQVGTGVKIMGIDRNFTQGALLTTANVTDLAISGNGFFVLDNGASTVYTRDGSFSVDVDGSLISPFTGFRVQGWQATDGTINTAQPIGDITIPLGTSTVANASTSLTLVGNLDSSDTIDGLGTKAVSGEFHDDAAAGAVATSATNLTDLENAVGTDIGFENGDYITIGATKGSGTITTRTFTVGTTGTTLGDLADFMQETYGIVGDSNSSATEGVTVSGGQVVVMGNIGEGNALTNITISGTDVGGAALNTTVFGSLFGPDSINGFTEHQSALGESSFNQTIIYDSLGVGHTVDMIFSKADASADLWSFFASSDDNFLAGSRGSAVLNTAGRLEFTSAGVFSSFTGNELTLNLQNGSTTPLTPTVGGDQVTQFGTTSSIALQTQDGFPPGVLESFTIATTGIITGIFSNGLTQDIGQVALAKVPNEDGMLQRGENLFTTGANSGTPQIGTAGTGGRGKLDSGFLEQSNVDLAREFSDLIITQRAYQASARTITAADALLAEAVNLV